jgi:Ca2+-binding RTX toxin-like protein
VATANPPVNLGDVLPSGTFTATQSSSYDAASGVGLVLDNNPGTFNHTNNSGNEWLRLDFNQPLDVAYVEIVNRPTWGSRLDGSTVSVLDDQGGVLFTSAPISGAASGGTITIMLPAVMSARAVRIDQDTNFLHIAELNVYGRPPAGVTVPVALLNTDLTIQGQATVVNTSPVIDTSPDNDTLYGGGGNDTLHGGAGNDALYGGTGAVSPFAEAYAIDLNQGVTTDQYLSLANYGGLAGATDQVRFTIEMLVSGVLGYNELISYANAQSSNAFLVSLLDDGNIEINYRGSSTITAVSAALLADGDTHRFSLTWDNRIYTIYIDGVAVGSGTHTGTATSLTAGGTLIIGQEQDSLGGGFNSGQILRGSVGDVRIFNDVRTAAEIAANAFTPLADPVNEQGLVSNWQVTPTSIASGALTDARGGAALVIAPGSGTAPSLALLGAWDNDTLIGGAGNDTLDGGAGDDVYRFGSGDGQDTALRASGAFGNDVIQITGGLNAAALTLARSGNDLLVTLTASANTLRVIGQFASTATPTVSAIRFDDGSSLSAAQIDTLTSVVSTTPSAGSDLLTGTAGADLLDALAGNDRILGKAGSDTLIGGLGNDTLEGGLGNDLYVTDNAADVVIELVGEGTDTVQSSVSWTLGANVEHLTLTGTAALNGTGNDLANTLTGNAGANRLEGGTGIDKMLGGLGDDTYVVDVTGDITTELASAGTDTVEASVSWTLGANLEHLTLTGSAVLNATGNTLANRLTGNAAANVLNGGTGADTLIGGAGDDLYVVDIAGDVVTELANEGKDTVQSSISWTLGVNIEQLTLTGTAALNGTGNNLANSLTGNSSANVLDGQTGADTMAGGAGNDTYVVDEAGDVITELASAGTDTLLASVTYTASANVENLTLTGSAAINATGNTLVNTLTGNAGANRLDGGAGSDKMLGGLGDDTYVVDATGDLVTESTNAGTDTVFASVTYTAAVNVENLTLTGTAAISATGNALANALTGNSSANRLTGGAGNDTLSGAGGADTVIGGLGNDTYLFQRGSGTDLVQDNDTTVGNKDAITFGADITADQLWFRKVGTTLEVSIIGTSDKATIDSWYLGSRYQIEQFQIADGQTLLSSTVDSLVNAMAAFAPPTAGQTTLPTNYQSSLNTVIAANWN